MLFVSRCFLALSCAFSFEAELLIVATRVEGHAWPCVMRRTFKLKDALRINAKKGPDIPSREVLVCFGSLIMSKHVQACRAYSQVCACCLTNSRFVCHGSRHDLEVDQSDACERRHRRHHRLQLICKFCSINNYIDNFVSSNLFGRFASF